MILATPTFDARRKAKLFYWQGYDCEQIAELLALNANTIRSWKSRDKWEETAPLDRVDQALEARLQLLIWKEHHTGADLKSMDALGRLLERQARVRRHNAPDGHEGDLNPKVANRNAGERKKARKNHLTADHIAEVKAAFEQGLFAYQLAWRGSKDDLMSSTAMSTRFILKSRQIGATYYFAREAFIRMLETGNNQIFISASRAQANNFRQYIVDFVMSVTGVKLEGDPIVLDLDGVEGPNGESPKLYFLGTNYRTAQSYHGDVYVDEAFWIYGFDQIDDVASAMASQKRYRITYFSTPSTIAHQAYRTWSGEKYNDGRDKSERVKFDFSDEDLRRGVLGPDGIWRQRVSIMDAEAGGCDLFDIERLRKRYAPDIFDNLFMCNFVDDSSSMFPFALMRRAMVDSWDAWSKDYDPYALRPYGDREVHIGVDPAESAAGDEAAVVVLAPPDKPGGVFRVLEKHRLKGCDFEKLAVFVLAFRDRYNVGYIAVDSTGMGAATWKVIRNSFPTARRIDYNVAVKTEMVLKAKNVFSSRRIQFDSGALDIAQSFMSIRAELTGAQKQITYVATRAGDTGHADLAWAIMHVLHNEPLDPVNTGNRKSRLRIGRGNVSDAPDDRQRRREPRGHHRDRRDPADRRQRHGRPAPAGLPLRRAGGRPRSARPAA